MNTTGRLALFTALERNASVIRSLLAGLPATEHLWKPAPEKWCALEVICHLRDEEREDFRARMRSTLEAPEAPWPTIDPAAWVGERRYVEQDFEAALNDFLHERERSFAWLRAQESAAWGNAHPHPKAGPVSCELLLTNWVAHDLHHIRQLINLRYARLKANATVPLDYAGTW